MSDTVKIEVNIKQHVLKSDIEDIDIFKIIGNDNASFESMLIYLPFESTEGIDFINILKNQ